MRSVADSRCECRHSECRIYSPIFQHPIILYRVCFPEVESLYLEEIFELFRLSRSASAVDLDDLSSTLHKCVRRFLFDFMTTLAHKSSVTRLGSALWKSASAVPIAKHTTLPKRLSLIVTISSVLKLNELSLVAWVSLLLPQGPTSVCS